MTDRKKHSMLVNLVTGSSATSCAVCFTHPMETIKTRLMLQGELMAKGTGNRVYGGVLHAFGKILRQEGPRGLYAGLGSGIVYQITMSTSPLRPRRGGLPAQPRSR